MTIRCISCNRIVDPKVQEWCEEDCRTDLRDSNNLLVSLADVHKEWE